jgi:capsid portal protein
MKRRDKRARRNSEYSAVDDVPVIEKPSAVEAFTFGEPTPVLDKAEILSYIECWSNGRYFEPPLSWDGLARSFRRACIIALQSMRSAICWHQRLCHIGC